MFAGKKVSHHRTLIIACTGMVAALLLVVLALARSAQPPKKTLGAPPPPGSQPLALGIPAEFEPSRAVILGCNELLPYHPQVFVDVVRHLQGRVEVVGLVANEDQREMGLAYLKKAGLSDDGVTFMVVATTGMWVRDYGPIFARHADGHTYVIETDYPETERSDDDEVPHYVAGYFHLPLQNSHLLLYGGNLLSNGQRHCFTTSSIIARNAPRKLDINSIFAVFQEKFAADQWTYVAPLQNEPTGHIDMFATFLAPNLVVVASLDPKDDPVNSKILDDDAARLATVQTPKGSMRVERLRMPAATDGNWRPYTNVIMANQTLLVPNYPSVSPDLDQKAVDFYTRLLPTWRVVGINADSLAAKRGSLHCVSCNVPDTGE